MSIEAMRRQHHEIDILNQTFEGRFRVLKGVEANILTDGRLDVKGEDLARIEMLLAAPHSKLRLLDDQTDRMLAAVRTLAYTCSPIPAVACRTHGLASPRTGTACSRKRQRAASRSRSTAIPLARISIMSSPIAPANRVSVRPR
jgi:hypothetical protein